jgi:hypothetical protein
MTQYVSPKYEEAPEFAEIVIAYMGVWYASGQREVLQSIETVAKLKKQPVVLVVLALIAGGMKCDLIDIPESARTQLLTAALSVALLGEKTAFRMLDQEISLDVSLDTRRQAIVNLIALNKQWQEPRTFN